MTAPAGLRLRRLDLAAVERGDPDAIAHRRSLVRRGAVPDPQIREAARATLADVRERGADAVRAANARVGGGRPDGRLILEASDLVAARDALARDVRRALDQAIDHVGRFAATQRPASTRTTIAPGSRSSAAGIRLRSVGAYVPGGSAPYPSSLVMTVVPAQRRRRRARRGRLARRSRWGHAIRCSSGRPACSGSMRSSSPVGRRPSAHWPTACPPPTDTRAADVLEPVDRIVGPGNAWVTAAKIEVAGEVGIDLPAGPSEGLVLATPPAAPWRVALDLVTQAEHGPDSPAILVTTDPAFADAVEREVDDLLAGSTRREILGRSLADHGRIVLAPDLDTAIAFVNDYAPEHLSVDLPDAELEPAVERLRNAGSLFVGPWAPESAGDYATGANHVLPDGRPRPLVRWPGRRGVRQVRPGAAHHARGPGRHPRHGRDARRGRRPARPPRRRDPALRRGRG